MGSVHESVRTIEELRELVAFHEAQVARQDSLPSRARAQSYLDEALAELKLAIELAEKYLPKGESRPVVVKTIPKDPTYNWESRDKKKWRRR